MPWGVTSPTLVSFLKTYPETLISLACFLILFHCVNRRRRPPVNWPVIGMLPGLCAHIHRLRDYGNDVLSQSACTFVFRGPWFLGLNAVVTCDPANVNHVFNANFANYPKGSKFFEVFDILGDGIFNSDGESWRSQRRRGHHIISDRRFRSFVAKCSQNKVEKDLLPLLNQVAEQESVVDLADVFLRLTFDTTCTLVLGVDPGSLVSDFPTVPFAKAVDDIEQALFYRLLFPFFWWKLTSWLGVGEERKLAMAKGVIDQFLAHTIAKRREERNEHRSDDLLTSYINDPLEGKDSDKFLRDNSLNLILAGRDTTGATLAWFFWLLSKNPDVERKILDELNLLSSKKEERFPMFDPEEVGKLVYLHAALCECLRLYPPVAIELKGVLQPDVLPSGVKVGPGTHLLFNVYSMGRMEGVWGKDCMEFKPERWISEQGKLRHEPSYKFLAFNCGPRTCLGKDMAFTQMKAVVAAMVYNFQVEVVEGHAVESKLSVILHMKYGMQVKIRKRGDREC